MFNYSPVLNNSFLIMLFQLVLNQLLNVLNCCANHSNILTISYRLIIVLFLLLYKPTLLLLEVIVELHLFVILLLPM